MMNLDEDRRFLSVFSALLCEHSLPVLIAMELFSRQYINRSGFRQSVYLMQIVFSFHVSLLRSSQVADAKKAFLRRKLLTLACWSLHPGKRFDCQVKNVLCQWKLKLVFGSYIARSRSVETKYRHGDC